MSTDAHTPAEPGGADSYMVVFDKVLKQFGTNVVLDHLDFTVRRGERVALIGPSGSGKTTILRLLMTLEEVNEGVIWVDGQPLTHQYKGEKLVKASQKHLRAVRTKIGMVFQQFNLFPNMTVLENITEAQIHVLKRSKTEAVERARELLATVGLADKENAHPTTLSGGQQQRVAIARALAMDPDILLLDEVTSALDPELVDDVLGVLRMIAETTDITMLLVTHEMGFARDVADRVLVFDKGKIVEEGTPEAIFTNPQKERTRTFLKAVVDR